ncbi:hypothetical protein [Streptomyces formicae]|uniref:Uncharacterized protein n=1 Tax=Streptomyces formicae TaxID=1616117 RepID=A0ABY3WZJ9_9ACTN|nr:hypothetical protein [Streptomyces formicae]UNM16914.1 hypothetical protein J4032_16135 [Streptomyces formicae]
MKRARQHGKPAPPAEEELRREIRDAEPDITERRRETGVATDLGTVYRLVHEQTSMGGRER